MANLRPLRIWRDVVRRGTLTLERGHRGNAAPILYTLIECSKRRDREPHAYLRDVPERLPGMKAWGNRLPASQELAACELGSGANAAGIVRPRSS